MSHQADRSERSLPPYYNSAEAGRAVQHFAAIQSRNKGAALRWGLPTLDSPNVPARYPGAVYVVQARTHHGKSLFADHVLRQDVAQLRRRTRVNGECDVVLAVKLEETVEQVVVQYWADPTVRFRDVVAGECDATAIAAAAARNASEPIIVVGFAAGRDAVLPPNSIAKARVGVDDLYRIVHALREDGVRVCSVIVDMINRMHDYRTDGRAELFTRISNLSQDLLDFASSTALPVVVFAQSVIRGATGFPGLDDIAGSSDIVRDAETVLSLWKPNRDRGLIARHGARRGSEIVIDGKTVELEPDMIGLKVLKYRNAAPDPATGLSIADREMLLRIKDGSLVEIDLEHVDG
jgi:hypothetical protein